MIGKPDPGCKPVAGGKRHSEDCPPEVGSLESARGGQESRPMFKATEKSTKPVTSGGERSTTGWVRPEDTAKDPTIP